jgi:hypothetical protein
LIKHIKVQAQKLESKERLREIFLKQNTKTYLGNTIGKISAG